MKKPIVTVTGPSGSGKTELLKLLCDQHGFKKLVSVTTRPPRINEIPGVDYYFITEDQFRVIDQADGLLQKTSFQGRNYATTKTEASQALDSGMTPIVIVEPSGVRQFSAAVRGTGLEVVPVFVTADLDVLIERYCSRLVGEIITPVSAMYHARRLKGVKNEFETWGGLESYALTLYNNGSIDTLPEVAQQVVDFLKQNTL